MNSKQHGKRLVKKYYDQETEDYLQMYEKGYKGYPADLIRFQTIILKRLKDLKVKTVLDAGCGSCWPMRELLKNGFHVTGFDFSKKMIEEGKKVLSNSGFNPNLITVGDIEKDSSLPKKKYDSAISLGVFTHLLNQKNALRNINKRLKYNGKVLIQFRNDLFDLFTFNNYSYDFFVHSLIDITKLPSTVRKDVNDFYLNRLVLQNNAKKITRKVSYNDILASFSNPLTIETELFEPCGFKLDRIHFYHYHVLPPIFESRYPNLFKKISMKAEDPDNWKGYFMASAFVVEATKTK